MKPVKITLLVIFCLVCAAAVALAEPTTLAFKFTKGETDQYRIGMDMSMSIAGMPAEVGSFGAKMSAALSTKTVAVYSDGSAKIKVHMATPKMTFEGKQTESAAKKMPAMAPMDFSITIAKNGKMLAFTPAGSLAKDAGMKGADFGKILGESGMSGLFPDGPVEVGDSWAIPVPGIGDSSTFQAYATFAGLAELSSGKTAATIKQSYTGSIDLAQFMKTLMGSGNLPMKGMEGLDLSQMFSMFTGTLDIDGSTDCFLAPQSGKMLGSNTHIAIHLLMNLPESAAAGNNAPKNLDMNMSMNIKLERVN